jgi:hypothetical protein
MLFLGRNKSRLETEEDKYLRIPSPEVVLREEASFNNQSFVINVCPEIPIFHVIPAIFRPEST